MTLYELLMKGLIYCPYVQGVNDSELFKKCEIGQFWGRVLSSKNQIRKNFKPPGIFIRSKLYTEISLIFLVIDCTYGVL